MGFKTKYEALQIPYPSDGGAMKAIEAQAVAQKAAYEKFCGDSEARIASLSTDLAKWEALDAGLIGTVITGIPHPDKPSFWPHDEAWEDYVVRLNNAEDDDHH